jgi:hypothetical protein
MRADLFVCSGVLILGLMAACRGDVTSPDAGTGTDSGVFRDGGDSDGGPTDPGGGEAGCDVARQTGCEAGAVCLRGVLGDGRLGTLCFPGECDPVAQNCPEGNRCAYVRRDNVTSRRCIPAGTVAEGGSCQSLATAEGDFYDTCAPGLSCTDRSTSSGGSTFTCQRFCYGGEQCTAPRDCIDVLRFEGSNERPRVCGDPGPTCDVLARECTNSRGCYPSPRSGGVCVTAGTIAEGQPCTYVNDCQEGSACVKEGASLVCRQLCRAPSGSPGCESGQHCLPLQDYTGVGVCVP